MSDGVHEIHGTSCRENNAGRTPALCSIEERGYTVILKGTGQFGSVLTSAQARYLASKLYRLARRIRQREVENESVGGGAQ